MLLVALWLAAVDGDLPLRMELEGPSAEVRLLEVQSGHVHLGLAASAQARISLPLGGADTGDLFVAGNTFIVENRLSYLNLFKPGYGVTLEADLLFRPPERSGYRNDPAMGLYVAFCWDWFPGDSADADPATRIRPDTMKIGSIVGGFKAEGRIEGDFYGALKAGIGAAHYFQVEADFDPAGFPSGRGELFADTWTYVLELRLDFGWRAGPLQLFFGFGFRFIGPPDNGSASTLDPGPLFPIDFELGIQLGF